MLLKYMTRRTVVGSVRYVRGKRSEESPNTQSVCTNTHSRLFSGLYNAAFPRVTQAACITATPAGSTAFLEVLDPGLLL